MYTKSNKRSYMYQYVHVVVPLDPDDDHPTPFVYYTIRCSFDHERALA